jgi:transcriptional regulator with XRE-family HTH domain
MISNAFVAAVRAYPVRQYRLARMAGMSPAVLSRWLNRALTPKPGDTRLLCIADLVGVPRDRIFTSDDEVSGKVDVLLRAVDEVADAAQEQL